MKAPVFRFLLQESWIPLRHRLVICPILMIVLLQPAAYSIGEKGAVGLSQGRDASTALQSTRNTAKESRPVEQAGNGEEKSSETKRHGQSSPAAPEVQLSADELNRAITQIRSLNLRVPIDGFALSRIKGSFSEKRGTELHHASDFLAERNTPIHAVCDGTVAKLFLSKPGGNTIYQYDPSRRFIFYYAHLDRYANGLVDGQSVRRGQIIGYVGTSGNAGNTAHLHFSVGVMDKEKQYWRTVAIDPYLVFSGKSNSN